MTNANKLLRDYLLTVAPLTALTGDNIAYPDLPAGVDIKGGAKAVVFSARGGTADSDGPLVRPSYQIRCWALRPAEARQVYGCVFDALHQQNNIAVDGGVILSALEETQPQDVTDEDTGWATVIGFYRLLVASS